MKKSAVRNLDHIVLPVPDLETSRARYEQLGFTVEPDGRHKFGSENACVRFSDGTFLEPLAIGHRETVEKNIKRGNTFLRRDAAYRFRNGENGFSCVVFSTKDARADRKFFKRSGYNTGKLVDVKRTGVHARITFAMDERAPDFSFFTCQDVLDQHAEKASETRHPNGTTGILSVVLHEQLPEDFQYFIQTISGQREIRSHSFGMEMKLGNALLAVRNDAGIKTAYGIDALPAKRGLRAVAFDLAVEDLKKTRVHLDNKGVEYREIGRRLVVPAENGQGGVIAFVQG